MPHSPEDKKRAVNRLRRIQGQAEALSRQIESGAECSEVLQQLAAIRGAVNGLMRDVMESHLRESFGHANCDNPQHQTLHQSIDDAIALVKSYIK
ncbi:metal-sensing transcriptional repressor [Neisseria animaloris]|uniref:metal-sensing transcriptional repressor n=1 Tax=Neisseria animaloris TaxID=326522 RepID=UPI0039E02E59